MPQQLLGYGAHWGNWRTRFTLPCVSHPPSSVMGLEEVLRSQGNNLPGVDVAALTCRVLQGIGRKLSALASAFSSGCLSSHRCLLPTHSGEKDAVGLARRGGTAECWGWVAVKGKPQPPQPDHTGQVVREVPALRQAPVWGLLFMVLDCKNIIVFR